MPTAVQQQRKKSHHFMEHEDSLPCSQGQATSPNSELDESSQHLPSYFFKFHFNSVACRDPLLGNDREMNNETTLAAR
jgi:hypothetical protein